MKIHRFVATTFAAGLLVAASDASAQSFYVGAYGGVNYAHESDVTVDGIGGYTIDSDIGYAVGGFVGYDFGNSFRLEGELTYRRNSLDSFSLGPLSTPMEGDASALALMVNGLYDFDSGSDITPHIGAGAGIARFSVIDARPVGIPDPPTSEDDTVFAYQFIVGVGYDLSPTSSFFVDYRLFATVDPGFTNTSGEVIELSYLSSALLFGISTSF
jgi:opacity protein-like surface antigen